MTIRSGGGPRDPTIPGPPVRRGRVRDGGAWPCTRSRPGTVATTARAVAAARTGPCGLLKFLRLRADPRRDRPRRLAHGPSSDRQQHRPVVGRGEPGGAPAAVRQGPRPRGPGRRADDAGLDGFRAGGVRRRAGRHGVHDRRPTGDRGPARRSADVRLHRHRPGADGRPPAGHVRPAQEHDARPTGRGPARRARDQVRRYRPADRPAARADHGQAPDPAASRWTRRTSTTSSRTPPAALIADYPWLKRSSPTRPRAPRSRASCGRPPTGSCPTRPPRSSSG